jgi:hypothetical protein
LGGALSEFGCPNAPTGQREIGFHLRFMETRADVTALQRYVPTKGLISSS